AARAAPHQPISPAKREHPAQAQQVDEAEPRGRAEVELRAGPLAGGRGPGLLPRPGLPRGLGGTLAGSSAPLRSPAPFLLPGPPRGVVLRIRTPGPVGPLLVPGRVVVAGRVAVSGCVVALPVLVSGLVAVAGRFGVAGRVRESGRVPRPGPVRVSGPVPVARCAVRP